ncbi:MAG: hypothetical protein JSS02_27890 [Planctomycetes bacterium]|nr:hypothetical protein [Planctomycetota bacterium]
MSVLVHAVDQPHTAPFRMPDRFLHEVTFFMSMTGADGIPKLPAREYWVRLSDSRRFLDDGCVRIVSALDSDQQAEMELTEEQEAWLEWMVRHNIEHIRLE